MFYNIRRIHLFTKCIISDDQFLISVQDLFWILWYFSDYFFLLQWVWFSLFSLHLGQGVYWSFLIRFLQEKHKFSQWNHTPSNNSITCHLLRLLWVTRSWMPPTSWFPHLFICTLIFLKKRPLENTAVQRARSILKPLTQVVVDFLCCSPPTHTQITIRMLWS